MMVIIVNPSCSTDYIPSTILEALQMLTHSICKWSHEEDKTIKLLPYCIEGKTEAQRVFFFFTTMPSNWQEVRD